jgi:hypothetical protein
MIDEFTLRADLKRVNLIFTPLLFRKSDSILLFHLFTPKRKFMSKNKLGRRIQAARLARRLSLRDLEALSNGGISNGYVSNIEGGHATEVYPTKLRILSDILGLNYLELLVLAGHVTTRDFRRGL